MIGTFKFAILMKRKMKVYFTDIEIEAFTVTCAVVYLRGTQQKGKTSLVTFCLEVTCLEQSIRKFETQQNQT